MTEYRESERTRSDPVRVLVEDLRSAGLLISEAECAPGDRVRRIKIHSAGEKTTREKVHAVALAAGLKALRIELQPVTPDSQVLIAHDASAGELNEVEISIEGAPHSERTPLDQTMLSAGGFSIALSGGDGAGKSTAISMLGDWLSPTLDVVRMHFGRPKALWSSALVYRSLGVLRRLGVDVPMPMLVSEGGALHFGALSKSCLAVQLLCLARDRRKMHESMRIRVGSGSIVLCDRYPDARISDMDGPRLHKLWSAPSPFQNRLIDFERKCYSGFTLPDLHIILRVSPDVAERRQPEDDPNSLRKRVEAVLRACENPPDDVCVVDADAPLEQVHDRLRELVWESI